MNEKVLYIADFFYEEMNGGGEANDHELLSILSIKKYDIIRCKSANVNLNLLKEHKNNIIISNFALLSKNNLDYITDNCKYIIYEHDHKYLKYRNPAEFENFKAPQAEIINEAFYRKASLVLCQSKFHKSILDRNLSSINSVSLSGNLWSERVFELVEKLSQIEKKDSYAIMSSNVAHKNTIDAIKFCNYKNYNFELIQAMPHEKFLEKVGQHKGLVFFPKTPETLSRIAVESRMMNMSVITNSNLGASQEEWFQKKGVELITIMKNKRNDIITIIESFLTVA